MFYKVTLDIFGKDGQTIPVHTFKGVKSDEELWACLGRLSVWFWLELERADYKDAWYFNMGTEETSLLAFTTDKPNDEPNGPHRHGLRNGTLAFGKCHCDGYDGYKEYECAIHIAREAE